MSLLKKISEKIEVETLKENNPKEFFQNRKGLYVWDSFINNIVDKADTTVPDKFKLSSFDLEKSATDEEIEKELPEKHIFSESEVCAIIASLIEKQPNGEEGVLKNTGDWNLFYTPSRVFRVSWSSDYGKWGVDAWDRDVFAWLGGDRVFSPATEA